MSKKNVFLNLNNKSCDIPIESEHWYNLETNRNITKTKDKITIKYPRIAASEWNYIYQFVNINNLSPDDLEFYHTSEKDKFEKIFMENATLSCRYLKYDNIENIPDEELKNLDEFSFSHIKTKAKIIEVLDGDTISIAMVLKGNDLAQFYWNRDGCDMKQLYLSMISKTDDFLMLLKLRIRLFGIDAAEKENPVGKRAKEWAILKYKSDDNINIPNQ